MKIIVSACLIGENCKYNGGNNYNQKLMEFLKGHQVIGLCPEVMGGLSTPRLPAEIVNGQVINSAGESVDEEFRKGAKMAFDKVMVEKPDIIILQSRSPSCGVKEIYDGSFTGKKITASGIFAHRLMEAGYKVIDVEDLKGI